ncbi:molybdopterin cofactor-binding domain-containing protein [Verminephrobacter eiseniae]|uniref:molybdopterin cofactor-binding domain-containing protein n=1 Tax=Verminephrobacter eiseniae TaxID=364317 RepID=UPI002237DB90|nr:molybdopterin cofactor-binding domain-containing protein [Verminephrobacter eiseniae]MCW5234630.1 aldehyde dehydrogenase [Verminephrobacter eiseniae]MCW5293795.1 aldehyde dehydrogenase [Verminephrobacter eiseniae]MCW8187423.1 aldehyde dehydrogenase [Verminephrobacter eiseniae]MCW8225775.1 aldehyde dehydrogenase [Verminephrobacter eiseniae]MCW8236673.1 aldehyde dehydrogenase [Verminephrobacter eiseniae]
MTRRADLPQTRAEFLAADGVLLVVREAPPPPPPAKGQPAFIASHPSEGDEVLLALWDDGSVSALNGHVDLGTGIQTALAQIVAEELDLGMPCVRMMLGDTARAPNQGATIASASIQIHAQPLRLAAAQARAWLLARAAERLGVAVDALQVRNGVVRVAEAPDRHVNYADLVAHQRTVLRLDLDATPKDPADYRLVGTRQARVDIPAKLAGDLVFVHDMRVPGMLHGRVVRPPYAGADHGEFIGNTLEAVDESSIAHVPGIRAVVVVRDFVGIVAEREEHAEQAMRELRVTWKPWPGMPDLRDVAQALRDNPSTQRLLVDEGDVDGAMAAAAQPMQRTYVWPYQMHASIGPSCALAEWQPADGSGLQLRCWAGSQNPHVLRADLAKLMGVDDVQVDVVRMEAAGCYGRNGADDVAADAALLARAVGAPVRVQLSREQEHAWEPKGAAQLMEIDGGLMADGRVAAYDFETSYPSNGAPTLALLLTRTVEPVAQAYEMGDRTARPPYTYDNLRVKVNDMAPIVRASWLRGVSALPSSFAHESYIDELATAAGVDPVQFRLRHLDDPRAIELVQATAQKAGWRMRTGPQENADGGLGEGGDILFGQGFAYARYIHSKWPGFGAAWAAWVADVEVNQKTGEVHVRRVVVGHDAGLLVNPAGVEHQVHGNVIQTTSRVLKEQVQFAPQQGAAAGGAQLPGVLPTGVVASREWGSYPIINFRDVPVIEVMHMPRPGEPSLGAGESSSVPGTAAIANAIFDATGVRFRSPPFTPETVLAELNRGSLPPPPVQGDVAGPSSPPASSAGVSNALWPRRKGLWATGAALFIGGLGVIAGLLGWRAAIAPVSLTAPVYSESTIERGRVLAALGDCAVCHTAPGGAPNAGGRAMDTPFGTLYTTNLTPDAETGLGRWSFSAFQRAMREGVSRDGHHLYPAFPYTAFAKTSDDDLQALYAYFMAMPAVRAETPKSELKFPFNLRPLMAGWNALFHDPAPLPPVPTQSAEWNRGAYLVNGLGHCGACHTPRNALGAEQGGSAFLSGAMVDGWEAPALTQLSKATVPWDTDALYRYLRNGHSPRHGIAGGPMAEVVRELAQVPDADVRAMAVYLGSFNPEPVAQPQALAQQAIDNAARTQGQLLGPAQRMFDSACASCHHDGDGPTLLGVNTPLALNSSLTSTRPDNLLRTILDGVRAPAHRDIGFMPAFREALDDRQLAELAGYMRARFAPQEAPWPNLPADVARVRATPGH